MTCTLTYNPTRASGAGTKTYGYVFAVGVPLNLGNDEVAYAKLKCNPEFAPEIPREADKASVAAEVILPNDLTDESNDGKDAKTRAAVQKRAIVSLKASPAEEQG